jgi:hypothetical protein
MDPLVKIVVGGHQLHVYCLMAMQELDGRPLRLSLVAQNPPTGSTPSPVQSPQEKTASGGTEPEVNKDNSTSGQFEGEMEKSNLQTTANY